MRPGLHVVLHDLVAQRAHRLLLLLGRHRERLEDRGLELVDVVGVDHHGRAQLVGRARELAEHEHAVEVRAGGDVLLGDEVHPVAQRGHQHHVRGHVHRGHVASVEGVVLVGDGRPAQGCVLAVDAADGQLDLVAQLPVGLHPLPGRGGDLDHHRVVRVDGPVVEQLAPGLQAVSDALGVVQAVHTEHDLVGIAEVVPQLRGPLPDLGVLGERGDGGGVDGDREGARLDLAPRRRAEAGHRDRGALHVVAQQLPHRGDEVQGVALALEADEVRAEQPAQDRVALGQLGEQLDGGEGDVVEEADPHVRALLADHPRYELQLVVVHPDRPAGAGHRRGRRGEAPIGLEIGVPPAAMELGGDDDVVVQRPQRRVGEALVIALHVLLLESHRVQAHPVGLEGGGRLARRSGPSHPGPGIDSAHHRLHRGDQAAGAGDPFGRPVGEGAGVDGQAIGDDDELVRAVLGGGGGGHRYSFAGRALRRRSVASGSHERAPAAPAPMLRAYQVRCLTRCAGRPRPPGLPCRKPLL